jgi:hypothetical protein
MNYARLRPALSKLFIFVRQQLIRTTIVNTFTSHSMAMKGPLEISPFCGLVSSSELCPIIHKFIIHRKKVYISVHFVKERTATHTLRRPVQDNRQHIVI